MIRISSKSKRRVWRLFTPPTARTGLNQYAPPGLTVRQLVHHRRREPLRQRFTMAEIDGAHTVSIGNLVRLGFDYYG